MRYDIVLGMREIQLEEPKFKCTSRVSTVYCMGISDLPHEIGYCFRDEGDTIRTQV